MADRAGTPATADGETVFCHICSNRWPRSQGGLSCPSCNSEFVEIVSAISTAQNARTFLAVSPSQPASFSRVAHNLNIRLSKKTLLIETMPPHLFQIPSCCRAAIVTVSRIEPSMTTTRGQTVIRAIQKSQISDNTNTATEIYTLHQPYAAQAVSPLWDVNHHSDAILPLVGQGHEAMSQGLMNS